MGLTTERKIFLGLMLVAGASLVVDQAIFSPSSASASSLDVDQISAMPAETILTNVTEPIKKSVTEILNQRLSSGAENQQISINASELQNMFSPLIEPAPEPVVSSSTLAQPVQKNISEPTQFIPTNLPVLTAVMPSRSGQSGAILNATLYKVGDTTPQGYRLLKVEQRQVLVEIQGNQFWINLPAFED